VKEHVNPGCRNRSDDSAGNSAVPSALRLVCRIRPDGLLHALVYRPADTQSAGQTDRNYQDVNLLPSITCQNLKKARQVMTNIQENFTNPTIPTPNPEKEKVLRLFEQYKKEMKYLKNFTDKTLKCYQDVFNRWQRFIGEIPNELNLSIFVIEMRQAGLSDVTCNISIRCFNSFLIWLKEKGICPQTFSNGKPFKLSRIIEEKRKMKVFNDSDLHKLVSFKPRLRGEWRLYALLSLLIDTGVRITEALTLTVDNVDFDNLVVKVMGKGRKERIIPISFELRKILHTYLTKYREVTFDSEYVFCSKDGRLLDYSNIRRDLMVLLNHIKLSPEAIDGCFHSFRRGFARAYIRNGGNIKYLKTAMGHATLEMTNHYVDEIEIEDLKLMHQKVGVLARLK
jgi:site-specific recombinase XerD